MSPWRSFFAVSHASFGHIFMFFTFFACISSHFNFAIVTAFLTADLAVTNVSLEAGEGRMKYRFWEELRAVMSGVRVVTDSLNQGGSCGRVSVRVVLAAVLMLAARLVYV